MIWFGKEVDRLALLYLVENRAADNIYSETFSERDSDSSRKLLLCGLFRKSMSQKGTQEWVLHTELTILAIIQSHPAQEAKKLAQAAKAGT